MSKKESVKDEKEVTNPLAGHEGRWGKLVMMHKPVCKHDWKIKVLLSTVMTCPLVPNVHVPVDYMLTEPFQFPDTLHGARTVIRGMEMWTICTRCGAKKEQLILGLAVTQSAMETNRVIH